MQPPHPPRCISPLTRLDPVFVGGRGPFPEERLTQWHPDSTRSTNRRTRSGPHVCCPQRGNSIRVPGGGELMFTESLLGSGDCIQCCGRVMSPDGHSDARREPWGARALERQRHLLTLTQPESRHSRTGAQPVPPSRSEASWPGAVPPTRPGTPRLGQSLSSYASPPRLGAPQGQVIFVFVPPTSSVEFSCIREVVCMR